METKAIMISIKPYWYVKILNGKKSIEVRKNKALAKAIQKLIDTQGYAPILGYCTKERPWLVRLFKGLRYLLNLDKDAYSLTKETTVLNGKVPALLICRKMEEIKYHFGYYDMGEWTESYILENSCLTAEELDNYLQASKEYDETKVSGVYGCGIHINKVIIFDKPKDISEFKRCTEKTCIYGKCHKYMHCLKSLTKAPQNWCYVVSDAKY